MNDDEEKIEFFENMDNNFYFCRPINNDLKINIAVNDTPTSENDVQTSDFTTLQLIDDLYEEVNKFAYILAEKFPEKYKMSLVKVSLLWGYNSSWLGKIKRGQRKTLETNRDKELSKLEIILRNKLGWNTINCLILIKRYRNNKLSAFDFIDKLLIEMGRIIDIDLNTKEIINPQVSFNLFSYILWGTKISLYKIKDKITGKAPYHNSNYKFSLENLDVFKTNLKLFFGNKANRCIEIINNYIKKNPDLKDYSLEQTTIKNKDYFSVIRKPNLIKNVEIIYWYGFLCADGAVYKDGRKYVINFRLKKSDKERVYRFADQVGLDKDRVYIRTVFRKFKKKIITSKIAQAQFGSKIMYNDIMSQGFSSSKNEVKTIPKFIYKLIIIAKNESIENRTHWWYTPSGGKALVWFLGLYDGDGYLKDGKYGFLTSGQREFLNLIARTFDCKYRAKSKGEPTGFSSNESFYLRLGSDLFDAMLNSFELSLKRKRPNNWKFGSHVRSYLD